LDAGLRYRNRSVPPADAEFIRALIAQRRGEGRLRLSEALCVAWNWRQE
jgi:hypothetical protein